MLFKDETFHDVPRLIAKADDTYEKLIALGKPDKWTVTKTKIYENRGWNQSKPYIECNFDAAIMALGVFYLPKALRPGPAFVFPLKDLDGRLGVAQTRPFKDSYLYRPDHKYRLLGTNYPFKGPMWCGNDDATLRQIISCNTVLLVEGPFDVLACKLLVPDIFVMSTLTKGATEDHIDYLRILGVNRIVFMFDNEESQQGAIGEWVTEKRIHEKFGGRDITVQSAKCSATDPSEALKLGSNALILKNYLESLKYESFLRRGGIMQAEERHES